ncbi:alpha-glucosidase [Paucilactobacillus wasatchensis]|uniref:Glycosidase like protein n=1 Tax=Paucilactobacillus wasatchensis TaxID=1335616 RepID=A0A0D0Y629_9LACO|nr:alpha-glucosidase [Paucilactobacillus wasatchensis]KIS03738.1 glycosidase like protein [Paucilactobacillus wasatchensis]
MTATLTKRLTYDDGQLTYNNQLIFSHTDASPILFLGHGAADIDMYRGNFDINDQITTKIPLFVTDADVTEEQVELAFGFRTQTYLKLIAQLDHQQRLVVTFKLLQPDWNRLWVRLNAVATEKIYGCGEQLSYFNLRGRHFPLWTSEPGVGRNKRTLTTQLADYSDHAGGNYYTTNYPQGTFISSAKYYCHTDSSYYADFDFSNPTYHELQFWGMPTALTIETAATFVKLIEELTNLIGRQPKLPDWINDGVMLGVQGGTNRVQTITDRLQEKNVKLAALWCQDWQGIRMTSFGKRLMWEWQADSKLYPQLTEQIKTWQHNDLRFLAYINPYIASDTSMFANAAKHGYFAKTDRGDIYLVDFGEFDCGVVDLTNPAAFEWFKSVIKTNLIDIGITGWMADFGEYLPTDVVLFDQSDPLEMHNQWPKLWAKCNYEAVQEAGKGDEIVYFMRAGANGSQPYTPLLWAGDQSVNWSLDDGLASTIPAALSAGMSGFGLSHSDIGGYTSLHGNIRSKELFMRWAEMGSFLPVMRTHEGNRPAENFQVYDDDEAMTHFAHCSDIFVALKPYRQAIMKEYQEHGLPMQRPLFMHYENDAHAYDIQYEYLFGRDLLVAPVYQAQQSQWIVYLPDDEWVHLWSGQTFGAGQHRINAPLGQPPVFFRRQSKYAQLFEQFNEKNRNI